MSLAEYRFTSNLDATLSDSALDASTITAGLVTSAVRTTVGYASDPVLICNPASGATSASLAVSTRSYVEFTISTKSFNKVMNLNSLSFSIARGGASTPRGYVVRSSMDNFASDIASADIATQRTTFTSINVDLSGTTFQQIREKITFRLYVYSPSTANSLDIDAIVLDGNLANIDSNREYLYKVYDENDQYKGIWDDVISDFGMSEEINMAASQVAVQLARKGDDFGEGVTVGHDYRVKIYVIDDNYPNGKQVFDGYITSYKPIINGADEYILVNIWNHAAKLDTYPLEETVATNPFIDNSDAGMVLTDQIASGFFGNTNFAAQSFFAEGDGITAVRFSYEWNETYFPGGPYGTPTVGIYTNSSGKPGTLIGYATTVIDSNFRFVFDEGAIPITQGLKYWVVFSAPDVASAGYNMYVSLGSYDNANDMFYSSDSGATWTKYIEGGSRGINNDMNLEVWNDDIDTTIAYNSYDPSDILRDVIDRARAQGSIIDYDGTTLETTGTTVSYTFNSNSIWEAMKKCVALAPAGWYLYIDQATNMVHFHAKNLEPDVTFTLGKEILSITPEKRIEDVVNTIYFVGGGDPPLFLRLKNVQSIERYGKKVKRYIDQRVTLTATGRTMAQTVLDQLSAGEIRFQLEVVSDSVNAARGRDLETIVLGMTTGVRNTPGRGPSLYDVSYYDQDYYDFNMSDLSSPVVQIVRIERNPDSVTIYCSTVPPDVSKRIEDINRNLEAAQTANNPVLPEE